MCRIQTGRYISSDLEISVVYLHMKEEKVPKPPKTLASALGAIQSQRQR